jgi:hypothetical protein
MGTAEASSVESLLLAHQGPYFPLPALAPSCSPSLPDRTRMKATVMTRRGVVVSKNPRRAPMANALKRTAGMLRA